MNEFGEFNTGDIVTQKNLYGGDYIKFGMVTDHKPKSRYIKVVWDEYGIEVETYKSLLVLATKEQCKARLVELIKDNQDLA